jgi:catechol 2,3-dioxygenase-like lactoylglutathione lyase family enzyme
MLTVSLEDKMSSPSPSGALVAVLPCNDLDASERFYARLGFLRVGSQHWRPPPGELDDYRILSNGKGGHLHLAKAVDGWLVPGKNPFGLYLYIEDVDAVAAEFHHEFRGGRGPEDKPWGTYELALSDPNETLVRVGWPTRLRKSRDHN